MLVCALYDACGPYPMLVDLIICLCAGCPVLCLWTLLYACGPYKAARDAITDLKAASEASGHADASDGAPDSDTSMINTITEFLEKMGSFVGEVAKDSDAEIQNAREKVLKELNDDVAIVFDMLKKLNFKDEQNFQQTMTKEAKSFASSQAKLEKIMKKAGTLYVPNKFETAEPAAYIRGISKFGHTP